MIIENATILSMAKDSAPFIGDVRIEKEINKNWYSDLYFVGDGFYFYWSIF